MSKLPSSVSIYPLEDSKGRKARSGQKLGVREISAFAMGAAILAARIKETSKIRVCKDIGRTPGVIGDIGPAYAVLLPWTSMGPTPSQIMCRLQDWARWTESLAFLRMFDREKASPPLC
jgi:hypothetical protein